MILYRYTGVDLKNIKDNYTLIQIHDMQSANISWLLHIFLSNIFI